MRRIFPWLVLLAAVAGFLCGELLLRSRGYFRSVKAGQTDRLDREYELLVAQFGDAQLFAKALHRSGLSALQLREKVRAQLEELAGLEQRIAEGHHPGADETRDYYESHRSLFVRPPRIRASHVFLAAHSETPPETTEAKRRLMGSIAARAKRGEPLAQLAAQFSEDEATKPRGGDLNYFSATRMPADFFSVVARLRNGETSKPFQTSLGFHLVQLTDVRPAAAMTFEEARGEIETLLANQQRRAIVAALPDAGPKR